MYVSGHAHFSIQTPIRPKGSIWFDRNYRWRAFPEFLDGGIIVNGPYKEIAEGTQLDIRVTHPSEIFVLVTHLPDRRNGGKSKIPNSMLTF